VGQVVAAAVQGADGLTILVVVSHYSIPSSTRSTTSAQTVTAAAITKAAA